MGGGLDFFCRKVAKVQILYKMKEKNLRCLGSPFLLCLHFLPRIFPRMNFEWFSTFQAKHKPFFSSSEMSKKCKHDNEACLVFPSLHFV